MNEISDENSFQVCFIRRVKERISLLYLLSFRNIMDESVFSDEKYYHAHCQNYQSCNQHPYSHNLIEKEQISSHEAKERQRKSKHAENEQCILKAHFLPTFNNHLFHNPLFLKSSNMMATTYAATAL